jgi:hypothetical protein
MLSAIRYVHPIFVLASSSWAHVRYPTTIFQTNYFDQVVQRYKHVIAGQFFGHSHQDQFAVGYSDYSRQSADTATSMAWVVPAITPRSAFF